jgi:hypothetical protein
MERPKITIQLSCDLLEGAKRCVNEHNTTLPPLVWVKHSLTEGHVVQTASHPGGIGRRRPYTQCMIREGLLLFCPQV